MSPSESKARLVQTLLRGATAHARFDPGENTATMRGAVAAILATFGLVPGLCVSHASKRVFKVVALMLCSAPVLAEVKYSIPEQYVGRWGRTLQSCADPGNDPLALRVESLRLTFPGNVARVQAVFTDTVLKISVLLDSSALEALPRPGEIWVEALEFELSSDHDTLTTVAVGRVIATRVRCPRDAT